MNDWVNNRGAGDSKRHRGHFDVNAMKYFPSEELRDDDGKVEYHSEVIWVDTHLISDYPVAPVYRSIFGQIHSK